MGASIERSLLVILALLASIQLGALATVTPFLVPGFHFDYNGPNQQPPIPITAQCETINLMWTRDANDTGPLPVAPYFFQVYTSTSNTPYIVYAGLGPFFEWAVPFAPNTLYQICMFDSNGVSGGCQTTYTVVSNTTVISNTTVTPTCQNVTAPSELSVSGTVPLGALSQYSYIDQCTPLSVTPETGTPPFTLTVAPSFHPPYNLTSNTMDPISWLVSLPVGYHFFLALSSSDGLLWANGPMQVGGLGPTSCLAPGTISKKDMVSIIVGTSIGGTVLGLFIGVLFIKVRRRRRRSPSQDCFASHHFSSAKPYKAPSVVPSTIQPSSSSGDPLHTYPRNSSSAVNPGPSILHSPPSSRPHSYSSSSPRPSESGASASTQTSRTRELPLEPLRPNRRSRPPLPEPPIVASSDSSSIENNFPLDAKGRLQAHNMPDDAAGASSNVQLPSSGLSRAPTYARHPPSPAQAVFVIDETEIADVPPEYGRHTNDTSCTPSIISSGRIPSGRF